MAQSKRIIISERTHRYIRIGAGVDQHLDQSLVSSSASVHEWGHALHHTQQEKETCMKSDSSWMDVVVKAQ